MTDGLALSITVRASPTHGPALQALLVCQSASSVCGSWRPWLPCTSPPVRCVQCQGSDLASAARRAGRPDRPDFQVTRRRLHTGRGGRPRMPILSALSTPSDQPCPILLTARVLAPSCRVCGSDRHGAGTEQGDYRHASARDICPIICMGHPNV